MKRALVLLTVTLLCALAACTPAPGERVTLAPAGAAPTPTFTAALPPTPDSSAIIAEQTRQAADARATSLAVDGLAAAATAQSAQATAQSFYAVATAQAQATTQALAVTRQAEAAAIEATRTMLSLQATQQASAATATSQAFIGEITAQQTRQAAELESYRVSATAQAEVRRAQWEADVAPVVQTTTVAGFTLSALILLMLATYAGLKWIRTEDLRRRVITGVDGDMVLLDRQGRGTAVVMPGRGFGPVVDVESGPEHTPLQYHDAANARYNVVKAVAAAALGGGRAATHALPGIVQALSAPADGVAQSVDVIVVDGVAQDAATPGVDPVLLEAAERDWMRVAE